MTDEMIRDQLVEMTNLPHIKEQLLLESGLSLGKAITVSIQSETVLTEAKNNPLEYRWHRANPQCRPPGRSQIVSEQPQIRPTQSPAQVMCLLWFYTTSHKTCCRNWPVGFQKIGCFEKVSFQNYLKKQEHAIQMTVLECVQDQSHLCCRKKLCAQLRYLLGPQEKVSIEEMLDAGSLISIFPDSIFFALIKIYITF